jgi:tetratricopeptide (TPR) repeat protein
MVADPIGNAGLDRRHQSALLALILVALSANLFYPGEIFFQSRFLLIFASLFAFLIIFITHSRSGNHRSIFRLVLLSFSPILVLALSLLHTVNTFRSQEVLRLFFSYAVLFLAVRLSRFEPPTLFLSLFAIGLVAFCLDVLCLYQYFFGLSDLKSVILRYTALDERFRAGLLARIATRRVFANFPLPNTLAGFLAMVLPLQVFLFSSAIRSHDPLVLCLGRLPRKLMANGVVRLFLCIQLCLSLLILALTQSFGGWVCFCGSFALVGIWLLRNWRFRVKVSAKIVVGLFIVATIWLGWITHKRGFSLWDLQAAENPIALRWINYKTALQIWKDFPWTGVGLGNYGCINPRYQSLPQNVSQYAHNTPLQLLSESGFLFFVALFLPIWVTTRYRRPLPTSLPPPENPYSFLEVCLQASLFAWLIHNLIDIDFYFPSLGGLGIFLIGLRENVHEVHCTPARTPSEILLVRRSFNFLSFIVAGITLLMTFFVVRSYLAESLYSLAIDHAEAKNLDRAQQFIDASVAIDGTDANKAILQAKIKYLAERQKATEGCSHLIALATAYKEAIQLDPFNAQYRYDLSRILSALGETKLASLSRNKAIELFPSEPKYREDSTSVEELGK